MNNAKYDKLESIMAEMDVLSHKLVEMLSESTYSDRNDGKPYEEPAYLHTFATPEQLTKLDILPGDKVKIEPYCGFLPSFASDFTYDENATYEVVKAGFSKYKMPVYVLSDRNKHTSVVPYCYLKLVMKASEPIFVLDNTSDPQGIIIKNHITGKAVIHINKNTASSSDINPVIFSTTLCEFLNIAVSNEKIAAKLKA